MVVHHHSQLVTSVQTNQATACATHRKKVLPVFCVSFVISKLLFEYCSNLELVRVLIRKTATRMASATGRLVEFSETVVCGTTDWYMAERQA